MIYIFDRDGDDEGGLVVLECQLGPEHVLPLLVYRCGPRASVGVCERLEWSGRSHTTPFADGFDVAKFFTRPLLTAGRWNRGEYVQPVFGDWQPSAAWETSSPEMLEYLAEAWKDRRDYTSTPPGPDECQPYRWFREEVERRRTPREHRLHRTNATPAE